VTVAYRAGTATYAGDPWGWGAGPQKETLAEDATAAPTPPLLVAEILGGEVIASPRPNSPKPKKK